MDKHSPLLSFDFFNQLNSLIENCFDILRFRVFQPVHSIDKILREHILADITSTVDDMSDSVGF